MMNTKLLEVVTPQSIYQYVRKGRQKLIKIISTKIETELTTTIILKIKSCSITTLHTNIKLHIRTIFNKAVVYQWHGKFTVWSDKI